MTFTIHKEAPKEKLVTMGQPDKEIEMAKEPEPDPNDYHLPSGATEPVLKNTSSTVTVTHEESASSPGPVGAGEEKSKSKAAPKKK